MRAALAGHYSAAFRRKLQEIETKDTQRAED
jgi:hypothetical protein